MSDRVFPSPAPDFLLSSLTAGSDPSRYSLTVKPLLGCLSHIVVTQILQMCSQSTLSVRLPLRDVAGWPCPTAVTQPTLLTAVFAVKKYKENGLISSEARAYGYSRYFCALADLHCLFCSVSPHDVSLCLARDELVLGQSLGWAGLWVAVKLTRGTPSPRYTLGSSTVHFRCPEAEELKSRYSFKIPVEPGSRSDTAARFSRSGCLPGDWVMCLRCS